MLKAARLVRLENRSITDAAKDLDIAERSLRTFLQKLNQYDLNGPVKIPTNNNHRLFQTTTGKRCLCVAACRVTFLIM